MTLADVVFSAFFYEVSSHPRPRKWLLGIDRSLTIESLKLFNCEVYHSYKELSSLSCTK